MSSLRKRHKLALPHSNHYGDHYNGNYDYDNLDYFYYYYHYNNYNNNSNNYNNNNNNSEPQQWLVFWR